jgi:hypothetical protein
MALTVLGVGRRKKDQSIHALAIVIVFLVLLLMELDLVSKQGGVNKIRLFFKV